MPKQFTFTKSTRNFVIAGIFIPGFTAIIILGFQVLLSYIGLECANAWKYIWIFSDIMSMLLPFFFYRLLNTQQIQSNVKLFLFFFNLLEYTFIQSALAQFFTNGQTLCYVTDGQNGIELVFTAWLALPILYTLSVIYQKKIVLTI